MKIKPCRSYHARLSSRKRLPLGDGRSEFKLYYISIVDRPQPENYEWERCALTKDDFEERLLNQGLEGIGFLTVFPHITKVFTYAPSSEILMYVRAFSTPTSEAIPLERENDYYEFACLAEAAIAADEYAAWAKARSVDEYLDTWSEFQDGPVADHGKLAAYWGR